MRDWTRRERITYWRATRRTRTNGGKQGRRVDKRAAKRERRRGNG